MEPLERPAKLRKTEHVARESCCDSPAAQPANSPKAIDQDALDVTELDPGISAAALAAQVNAGGSTDLLLPAVHAGEPKPLSKNQQKKLRKRQEWEAKQPLRKAKKKEQRKAKKQRDRLRKANESDATRDARAAQRRDGQLLPVAVIFDCSYDELMYEKEIVSLASQLTRCYSENRNAKFKAHLVVSSFGGRLKDRFDTILKGAHRSWGWFTFSDEAFDAAAAQAKQDMELHRGESLGGAFAALQQDGDGDVDPDPNSTADEHTAGEIIYLSSDSDHTLTELKPYSTYIVGGLVDRNRYKGKCYKSAMEKGVKTARLPIGEYLEMSTRHILTTNHVLEIMLKWLELRDWGAAFTAVIPKRKGGVLKSEGASKNYAEDAECVIEESGLDSDEDSEEDSPDAAAAASDGVPASNETEVEVINA